MACATLKRSLDWESINQRPSKRRRCMPFGSSRQHPSSHLNKRLYSQIESSPSSSGAMMAAAAHHLQQVNKSLPSEEYMHNFHEDHQQFDLALSSTENRVNIFPKLTPEKMAQNVHEEIKRLANRRKQLQFQVISFQSI